MTGDRIAKQLRSIQSVREIAARTPRAGRALDDRVQAALAAVAGEKRAYLAAAGVKNERELLALKRREVVARLTAEGRLVREIAAEVGICEAHVVAIRGQLGIGRRR